MLNRREFMARFLAATAAAAALDVNSVDLERILWTPEAKTIFLPPTQGWQPAPIEVVSEIPQSLRDQWTRENRATERDWVTMPDGKKHLVHNTAHTGVGHADFDIHGNLLRLGGRIITSSEDHANAAASHYQSWGHHDSQLYAGVLHASVARRAKAGVYDVPRGRQRKTDLERLLES